MDSGQIYKGLSFLFQSLDPNVGEDFVLPMRTAVAGTGLSMSPRLSQRRDRTKPGLKICFEARYGLSARTCGGFSCAGPDFCSKLF